MLFRLLITQRVQIITFKSNFYRFSVENSKSDLSQQKFSGSLSISFYFISWKKTDQLQIDQNKLKLFNFLLPNMCHIFRLVCLWGLISPSFFRNFEFEFNSLFTNKFSSNCVIERLSESILTILNGSIIHKSVLPLDVLTWKVEKKISYSVWLAFN